MLAITIFFVGHWISSVFFQSLYLHRYCAHRMFTMSKGWERFFHFCTFVTQGSSFLMPRGYMLLHREHHAFSDTARDPHSPHVFKNLVEMMNHTRDRYRGILAGRITPEARFDGDCPSWPAVDSLANGWTMRLAFGTAYTLFYIAFAPHWACFLLLPFHYLMGPVHGAIVNWAGHMYGYRNFDTNDRSRNTLIV
ncbi:MAG: acyl-CoA desaturase, partial [Myxococcales bacterium]|nr:acyl-CoA desaturase [Myxococcales bacterium]